MKAPRPGGCFTANYPDKAWRSIPCKEPPHILLPPSRGAGTGFDQVGDGPDFSAVAPSGHILQAQGSFDPATSVTSECNVPCPIVDGQITCPATPSCTGNPSNVYSLQLNSKPFSTSTCSASPNKSVPAPNTCQGWEQFVYESSGSGFIQYWLENYGPAGTTCPLPHGSDCSLGVDNDGWCPFQFTTTGNVYCVVNAAKGISPPAVPASKLSTLQVDAASAGFAGMADDSITVTVTGGAPVGAPGNNYFPDLGSQLTEFEFNVFGSGGGSQAVFNSGAVVAVRSAMDYGGSTGPKCDGQSFTGESNNLTLSTVAPAAVAGSLPALLFTETNPAPAGGPATCADAASVGDTHLTRVDGTRYDFQATGDFLLAQAGSSFSVHTRQARANTNPTWIPNASITKAVAMLLNKTQVELYVWPVRLVIDGKASDLGDGKSVLLSTGVRVLRRGDVYTVAGPDGDSVRATVNNNGINQWIDVSVGFGRSAQSGVDGLLGVPQGKPAAFKLASGAVLADVTFASLYQTFAKDWEVQAKDALLAPDPAVKPSAPEKPFYASDLDAQSAQRARAICTAAGVKDPTLLDDCTLDTAVLGGGELPARALAVAIIPRSVLPHLTR